MAYTKQVHATNRNLKFSMNMIRRSSTLQKNKNYTSLKKNIKKREKK